MSNLRRLLRVGLDLVSSRFGFRLPRIIAASHKVRPCASDQEVFV